MCGCRKCENIDGKDINDLLNYWKKYWESITVKQVMVEQCQCQNVQNVVVKIKIHEEQETFGLLSKLVLKHHNYSIDYD